MVSVPAVEWANARFALKRRIVFLFAFVFVFVFLFVFVFVFAFSAPLNFN